MLPHQPFLIGKERGLSSSQIVFFRTLLLYVLELKKWIESTAYWDNSGFLAFSLILKWL